MTLFNKETRISVNLATNRITIKKIIVLPIFNEHSFTIESDAHGYSELQYRNDGIYEVNVLEGKVIEERKISESTAKDIIRDVIETRMLAQQ